MSSGGSLTLSSKTTRRRGFIPTQDSAVKCWLQPTATSGQVASLIDRLNNNPATQSTPGSRPTAVAAANGIPMLSFDGTDDLLIWPFVSANNGSPRWGWAGWIRPATVGGVHTIISGLTLAGASVSKLVLQQNNTDIFINVHQSNSVARRGTAPGILALNTYGFLSAEFDGDQSAEADECIITWNNVKQTHAFVNDSGAPDDMPDVLVQPTGNWVIGDIRSASPLQPWQGLIGTQYILGGAGGISGGGLLTTTRRQNLMNFQRPA
jgi:hypothetical protein